MFNSKSRLSGRFIRIDIDQQIIGGHETASGREDDVDLLVEMNGCLIHGLAIQQQIIAVAAYLARIIEYRIEIAAPLLPPRHYSSGSDSEIVSRSAAACACASSRAAGASLPAA